MKKFFFIIFLSVPIFLILLWNYVNLNEDKSSFLIKIKNNISPELKNNIKMIMFPQKIKKEAQKFYNFILKNEKIITQANFTFKLNSKNTLSKLRNLMIEEYILDKEQVAYSTIDNQDQIFKNLNDLTIERDITNIFSIKYYDLKHYSIFHKSPYKCDKKRLFIYANDHSSVAYQNQYFLDFKKIASERCYDFLILGMSARGYNVVEQNSFPNQSEEIDKTSHEIFKTFYDPRFPQKKPLSLMLSANYYFIKEFIKNHNHYDKILMGGISGGGWTTTFLSSIITEIDASYSIAGTQPLIFYTNSFSNMGDWEQIDSKIYDKLDYVDLYLLSTLDNNLNTTRTHYQIYNDQDTCCFLGPTSKKIKEIFDDLNVENFKVLIWKNNAHTILPKKFLDLIDLY